MMAVMVFAIPMGVSASSLMTSPETGFNEVIVIKTSSGLYRNYSIKTTDGDNVLAYYDTSNGTVSFKSKLGKTLSYNRYDYDGTSWSYFNSYTSDIAGSTISGVSSFNYSTVDIKKDSYSGSNFFTAPPPPPKPVQIQAVKTVQEIVPQAGAVAGGIVLVASIILGLWLMVGLVKRSVYSFLR